MLMYIFAAAFFFALAWLLGKLFIKAVPVLAVLLIIVFAVALVIYGLIPFMAYLFSHSLLWGIGAIIVMVLILIAIFASK